MNNYTFALYWYFLLFGLASQVSAFHKDTIKIALVGGSGRSSLVDRFVKDKFNRLAPATIGYDFASTKVDIDEKSYKLIMWYSSNHPNFKPHQIETLKEAHAVLIAIDLSDKEKIENILQWAKEAERNAANNCPIIVVGTKCDLNDNEEYMSRHKSIKELCEANNLPFFDTSSKNNININEVFMRAAIEARKRYDIPQ
jgi:small GTP-binding protein